MTDNKNNSGYENSGNWNSGNGNSGNENSGNYNSGNRNSGDGNSGNWNSGDGNSGNWNSGEGNSGNWNSGNDNSGNWNSGCGNSGNWNNGMFNTDEPFARFFNRETNIKMSEFLKSERCPSLLGFSLVNLTKWIDPSEMTDDEKKANPEHETCGGYLKTFGYKEAWSNFWKDTTEDNRQKFLNLPNFDATIFKEITGIDVAAKPIIASGTEVKVEINGQTYVAVVK